MRTLTLYNARIMTMDPSMPAAWGITIENGRIANVLQSESDFRSGADIKTIDMNGRLVVPGFNDCHMHILPYGLDLSKADLSVDAGVRDVPALCRVLRKWADA